MNQWTSNNSLRLLENGEEFFPAVLAAIDNAKEEVFIETFIWSEDTTGRKVRDALVAARQRGVQVGILVDDYGTPGLSKDFLRPMENAGIAVRSFDPQPSILNIRTNMLCRMHRKIAVVDSAVGFVGGINICDTHLRSYGSDSKQDYAVQVSGPAVPRLREFCRSAHLQDEPRTRANWRYWLRRIPKEITEPGNDAQVLLVQRDNREHPTDIETLYRLAIRNCTRSMIIANAYFFPGYRFIRQLCRAARGGAEIIVVVQGKPDRPMTVAASSVVYDDLLAAGVRIFEYTERPLHAKVAVMDDNWATVGSSNLDPVSLGLNLEANLFIFDQAFSAALRANLTRLIETHCTELIASDRPKPGPVKRLLTTVAYHLTRHMWSWGRSAGIRKQRIEPIADGPVNGLDTEHMQPNTDGNNQR
ncbi:MAG: cardiolipin synthase ClsB [Gammaproteobacteria bacterium]|jgi:cardiolipin synthase|nr:cardiolipin synthase ClsB [Gammaproteobacteria bacterium]